MATNADPTDGTVDRDTNRGSTSDHSYIYALTDPSGNVRYVGKTRDPSGRLLNHQRTAQRGVRTAPVYRWLRELHEPPALVILQRVPAAEANAREVEWILRMRAIASPATPLLNVKPGMPTALRGKPKTPEHRAAIAAGVQRYYDCTPRTPVTCPGCGRQCDGEKGLNSHQTHPRAAAPCKIISRRAQTRARWAGFRMGVAA